MEDELKNFVQNYSKFCLNYFRIVTAKSEANRSRIPCLKTRVLYGPEILEND